MWLRTASTFLLLLIACTPMQEHPATSNIRIRSCVGQEAATISDGLSQALTTLSSLDIISGNAVGPNLVPGGFAELAKYLLVQGSATDYAAMANHEDAIVRCMGMMCLALSGGEDVVSVLGGRLDSRARVKVLPFGCLVQSFSEAEFARMCFQDPSFFGPPGLGAERISVDQLRQIDLGILTDDAKASIVSFMWGSTLSRLVERQPFRDAISALQHLAPDASAVDLAKAIGRLSHDVASDLLVSCLSDDHLEAEVRLAAASSLVMLDAGVAVDALAAAKASLDVLYDVPWGTRLHASAHARARLEESAELVQAARADWREIQAQIVLALQSHGSDDPVNFHRVREWYRQVSSYRQRPALVPLVATMRSMARRLDEVASRWHAHSMLPFHMFDFLATSRSAIGEEAWSEIASCVRPYLSSELSSLLEGPYDILQARLNLVRIKPYYAGVRSIEDLLDEAFGAKIEDWVEGLSSSNLVTRRESATRLATAGWAARRGVDALKTAIHDPDSIVSGQARAALAGLGEEAVVLLPGLGRVTSAMVEAARSRAARRDLDRSRGVTPDDHFEDIIAGDCIDPYIISLIQRIGPRASSTRVALIELLSLEDGASVYADEIAGALFWTATPCADAASEFIAAVGRLSVDPMRDSDIGVTDSIRCAMIRSYADQTELLRSALQGDDVVLRRGATRILSAMGPYGRFAIDGLRAAVKSEDASTRFSAVVALGEIGPDAHSAIPELASLTCGQDESLAIEALLAIEAIGPDEQAATPVLAELAGSGRHRLSDIAARALAASDRAVAYASETANGVTYMAAGDCAARTASRFGATERRELQDLLNALSNGDLADVRTQLEWAIQDRVSLKPLADYVMAYSRRVVPVLTEMLSDRRIEVRVGAARLLAAILGPEADEALAVLEHDARLSAGFGSSPFTTPARIRITGWRNGYEYEYLWHMRYSAENVATYVDELLTLGAPAERIVPVLEILLRSSFARERACFAWALGKLGPEARSAERVLIRAAADEDENVRIAARGALEKIRVGDRPTVLD